MADAVPTAEELPKHCYMDISVAGSPPETVVFELDTTTCPKTCHNFLSLCAAPGKAAAKPRGRANASATTPASATYRNTEFHRIIKGFMAQGGDFENFDGTGGRSIYSTTAFEDESFANKHSAEGILSMANRGRHTNSSQFFITLGNASHLDGKHVAFGRVVRGMDAVRQMATVETDARDKPIPMQRIVVVDCGIGMGNINSSSKGDQTMLGDKKAKKAKKEKKEKRRSKQSRRDRSDSSSSSSSVDSSSSDNSSHYRHRSKKHKKRKRERSRSRSRDRECSSRSKRHSHKERKRSKKKHKHSSRHRERYDDMKQKRRSRSRSR